ncbi:hypothetical protein GOBAR_AA31740 [Gossypium barbadense]|uniref:Uncharacterized protein n=1 Tax=Gossypium barbadense TaxID=3634 RepID=A0A2P5WCW5_GOSBA|nr:hypothetical protein GOBAR_AA31740 [Gossypium barbadense]
MSSSREKKTAVPVSKKRKEAAAVEQVQLVDAIRALLTTDPWEIFFGIIEPTYLELTMELCSTFHLQTVMTNYNDPGTVQFHLGRLVRQLSAPEFETDALIPGSATYTPSRSKASALPPSLRYLHSILAHTLTGRMGVSPLAPMYGARHFGLLNTVAQESSLTLIGQMSLQGISSMLSMRMIDKLRGTYPPQYRLAQFIEEEAPEDITDDVPHSTRTHRLSHDHLLVQVPDAITVIKSSKAHYYSGTRNSTGNGSP